MAPPNIQAYMTRIADLWELFDKKVLPPHVHPVQRQEMRRAFYAGAFSVMEIILAIGKTSPTDQEGADALHALMTECVAFIEQLRKGEV